MVDNNQYREPITGERCYRLWQSRISRAIKFRENHWNGDTSWKKFIKMYLGNHWHRKLDTGYESSDFPRDYMTVNKTLSSIKNLVSFVLQSDPLFMAEPLLPDDVLSAKIQAQWLNLMWRTKEMKKPLRQCVLDFFIIGHMIAKTGFWFEVDDNPKSVKKDGSLNYDDYITREEPFIYRVNPRNFVWDYDSKDLEQARWCCEIIHKPLNDVMNNTSYNAKAINLILNKDCSPEIVSAYNNDMYENQSRDITQRYEDDTPNIVLQEVWDKKYRKYYLFAKGVWYPLVEKDWPYDYLLDEGEGFPYELIGNIDAVDQPFDLGIPFMVEDQQLEKNRIRTRQVQRSRKDSRKYGVRRGTISDPDFIKLERGEDGTIIEIDGDERSIWAIPEMQFSTDAANVEARIDQDFLELAGSDALTSGSNLPSRTTSNEISTRTAIAGKKLGDTVSKIDSFVTNLGYKILSHSRNNIYRKQVIKLLGAYGDYWQTFDRDKLSSRHILTLQSTSKEPVDPVIDRQQRTTVYQLTLQNLPMLSQAGVQVNIGELFKWMLESYGIQDVTRFFPSYAIITKPIPLMSDKSIQQKGSAPLANPQMPQSQDSMAGMMGMLGSGGMDASMMGSMMGGQQ